MTCEQQKTRHLTQRDLAERWGKAEATIERYRSDGVGPRFLKLGGGVRYRLEDIEQFERECLYDSPSLRSLPAEPADRRGGRA